MSLEDVKESGMKHFLPLYFLVLPSLLSLSSLVHCLFLLLLHCSFTSQHSFFQNSEGVEKVLLISSALEHILQPISVLRNKFEGEGLRK